MLIDGHVLHTGGSWNPVRGGKHKEKWNGQRWSLLPGAISDSILANGKGANFAATNMPCSVLICASLNTPASFRQSCPAGPTTLQSVLAQAERWYGTRVKDKAHRHPQVDATPMASPCAYGRTYDATACKIHVAGGSPDYENAEATSSSHMVAIGAQAQQLTSNRLSPRLSVASSPRAKSSLRTKC